MFIKTNRLSHSAKWDLLLTSFDNFVVLNFFAGKCSFICLETASAKRFVLEFVREESENIRSVINRKNHNLFDVFSAFMAYFVGFFCGL